MALKDRLRSQRSKRFGNVAQDFDSKSEEMNLSSSDTEAENSLNKFKVRRGFSVKRLMKESECHKVDDDHSYTNAKAQKEGNDIHGIPAAKRRKISEESDEQPAKRKCFSKNAVMARLNRERKKKYISSLETENEDLRKRNEEINRRMELQDKEISSMKREILYLKGLLANSTEIGHILKNLKEITGLPITSSLIATTQVSETESVAELDGSHPARVRCVNSGSNFPILDKDVNLGSCSDKSFSCSNFADSENYPFDFEGDSYDCPCQDNSLFNFGPTNSGFELEESLKFYDSIDKSSPDVGICLHVNQKRVSVEICSICNSKAKSSLVDIVR